MNRSSRLLAAVCLFCLSVAPALALASAAEMVPADPASLAAAFRSIAETSPRVALLEYGESYEGRPLLCAVAGAPERIANLDAVLDARARHAAGEPLDLPLVIWIGACVHGDETSGSDAALALLERLAEADDPETHEILDRCILLIDPVQNPDGRAHFLDHRRRWASPKPVIDDQDLGHREGWPSGRGNHYLLDLNRDWFALSQQETQGRVALFLDWHPELSFDLHEMGANDSYLFSPPREPFNPHLPATTRKWWEVISADIAAEFGARGWSCYSGDWNEEFNPNRGAAWPLHLGCIAYLGEQATSDGLSILRSDGDRLDYARAVDHQFTAAWSLIRSAAPRADEIQADFRAARAGWPGQDAAGTRLYVVDTSKRPAAARRLAELLTAQGIEVNRSKESFRLDSARSYWGELRGERRFPAGSYFIDLAQPEGRLAAAILDFDPIIGDDFLTRERQRRESDGGGLMYESSAWSLAMACGAEVYAATKRIRAARTPFAANPPAPGRVQHAGASYAFLLHPEELGADRALAACLEEGLLARAGDGVFRIGGVDYPAGSVFLPVQGNPADLAHRLHEIATATGAGFRGVDQPRVESGQDLGSRHYRSLRRPRVALLGGPPFYQTTFGALWHYLERELAIPVSRLRLSGLGHSDLDRYSLIIVPDAGQGRGAALRDRLGDDGWAKLRDWVHRGGSLITLGEGCGLLFGADDSADSTDGPLGAIRARRSVLDELSSYRAEYDREATLAGLRVDEIALRRGEAAGITRDSATGPDSAAVSSETDAWLRRFSPGGAILRVDLDADHWLGAGVGPRVPVLVRTDLALLARRPAESVGRFAGESSLRLSGLLWPEARERWAGSLYLGRERVGDGQVIAFLGNPVYRRTFHGSSRLLANALLLGPGMGTRAKP
jgi:hypothetical protein